MKTILVATDFSPAALNAALYAADMAAAINAELCLLHVYQLPIAYGEPVMAINMDDIIHLAEKDMKVFKDQLIQKKAGISNIQTETRLGSFFEELKTVCKNINPYAVVIGSQGKTTTERILLGSHAVYTMKHLEWPLITVPAGAQFLSVKKIGLACDFADVVNSTPIDEIKTLVNDFNAELHVINIGTDIVFNPDMVFGRGMLHEMVEGLNPQYHFLVNDNTDEAIIDFAEKNHIDLLLVLPKRYNFFDQLVHKSHTKQLVLHSHVPVMALHQ